MHPWFDIGIGNEAPSTVRAFIEIERNSRLKLELDKGTGLLKVDRVLHGAVHYPHSYGFIPKTYCEDDDPLDIFVLCTETIPAGTIVTGRVIGVMKLLDQGVSDDKIISVAANDPEYAEIFNISQLPVYRRDEMKKFFSEYKTLENKEVKVSDFLNHDEASKVVQEAMDYYQREKKRLTDLHLPQKGRVMSGKNS